MMEGRHQVWPTNEARAVLAVGRSRLAQKVMVEFKPFLPADNPLPDFEMPQTVLRETRSLIKALHATRINFIPWIASV